MKLLLLLAVVGVLCVPCAGQSTLKSAIGFELGDSVTAIRRTLVGSKYFTTDIIVHCKCKFNGAEIIRLVLTDENNAGNPIILTDMFIRTPGKYRANIEKWLAEQLNIKYTVGCIKAYLENKRQEYFSRGEEPPEESEILKNDKYAFEYMYGTYASRYECWLTVKMPKR